LSTVEGLNIEDRLLFANAVASLYVGGIDCEPPPTIETVEKLLDNNTKKK
jgi:hypothetical protein